MCLFTLILISNNSNAQGKAVHFKADWNSSNNVDWFDEVNTAALFYDEED